MPCLNHFASTRSAQIATVSHRATSICQSLCLHTLRADCNLTFPDLRIRKNTLPPHAPRRLQPPPARRRYESLPLCLHTLRADCNGCHSPGRWGCQPFASTRSAQIATAPAWYETAPQTLCLHTLRADCNAPAAVRGGAFHVLCLHTLRADCNNGRGRQEMPQLFASTRSAQIATRQRVTPPNAKGLCLHTLRADCNGRNAQNCNIHFSERVLSR